MLAYAGEVSVMPSSSSKPGAAWLLRGNLSLAVRIPVELELPGERALIHREGYRLIIEPVCRTANIVELIAAWRKEPPLRPEDGLPEIEDEPARQEDIF